MIDPARGREVPGRRGPAILAPVEWTTDGDAAALRGRLMEALGLKELPRAGWVRAGVPGPESVAAHSWGVAWLVLVLCPSRWGAERRERALAMALVHDLAEVRVGDITPHDRVAPAAKAAREGEAFEAIVAPLPRGAWLRGLWAELEARSSAEARLVWACDKLDMALQAARYGRRHAELDLEEFVASALAQLQDDDVAALARGGGPGDEEAQ